MHKCQKCEKEWAEEFSFCPFCGEKYVPKVEEPDQVAADVERIKSIIPILKNVLGGVNEEKAELLSKISEQQKVLDETVKELTELKEIIKQNALVPMNYHPQFGPMPYPQYPAYVYPSYVPQGGAYPAQGGASYPQANNPASQPSQQDKVIENAIVVDKDKQETVLNKDESKPQSKVSTRIMSFLMFIISLVGIIIPCFVAFVTVGEVSYTGVDLFSQILANSEELIKSMSTTSIIFWMFVASFALALICLFADVIFGVIRLIRGKTKGRFYYTSFFALGFLVINLIGIMLIGKDVLELTAITDIVNKTFRNVLEAGYFVFLFAVILRFVTALFVKCTRISKRKLKKQARKEAKKALKLEKQAR